MRISDPKIFQNCLHQLLIECHQENSSDLNNYSISISDSLPKRNLTTNGMIRLKIILLRMLKSFYKTYWTILEMESLQFHKDHWILFFQPEKQTTARKQRLNEFSTEYP